jgi:hypothetical protein
MNHRRTPNENCSCGLPWELCTATGYIETLCLAATRGEVINAQVAAQRALELIGVSFEDSLVSIASQRSFP